MNTVKGSSGTLLSLACAIWMASCLVGFLQQPVTADLSRLDVMGMLLDQLLGIDPGEASGGGLAAGPEFLSQRIAPVAQAGALLILAASMGMCFAGPLLSGCVLRPLEYLVIVAGTGLSLLSSWTLLLGVVGQMNRAALFAPLALTLPVGGFLLRRWWQSRPLSMAWARYEESGILRWVMTLVSMLMLGWLLLGAISPPTDFDVREYHLQGPKEWLQSGSISFLRHNVYTSFPFLSEMLSLAAMICAGDWYAGVLSGKLLLAVFQLLSFCSVLAISERWLGRKVSPLAGLIYITSPWTLRISLIAYAEGALSCYLTISLLLILVLNSKLREQQTVLPWLVAGVLMGSAMASKYTGLLQVIIPLCVVCVVQFLKLIRDAPRGTERRERLRQFLAAGSMVLVGILLACGPWLLRNWSDTGNPVYPMAYQVFGGAEWNPALEERWQRAHGAPEHEIWRLPGHLLDVGIRNTWVSPLLLMLGFPGLIFLRRSPVLVSIAAIVGWGFFMWWALTHRIDRFWVPLIPLIAVICGAGCGAIPGRPGRLFTGMVVAAGTVWNVYFCTLALVGFHPGWMDLEAARKLAARPELQALNETLGEQSKVLMVGDAEVFDAEFPLQYNTVFDDSLFEDYFCELPPVRDESQLPLAATAEIESRLLAAGITHVLVNWGEILRYRIPGSYGYAVTVQPSLFQELQHRQVLGPEIPRMLTPLERYSEMELKELQSWDGWQQLLQRDSLKRIVLYPVTAAEGGL